MRRVLFVAMHFPPTGGAGVQRSVKFVKYLPGLGWAPEVLTGPEAAEGRWQPRDGSLAAELPDGLPVHRIATPAPAPTRSGRLARWLGTQAPETRWLAEGLQSCAATVETRPDLVFVTLSPYEALAPALALATRWDCPVVVDLRDPWALDEVRIYPSRWHRRRELAQMRTLLARCAAVIWNTPEAQRAGRELVPELAPQRHHCIPNGYDEADFAGLGPRAPDGEFRIVHSGYLHTQLGLAHRRRSCLQRWLGGELVPVDFLSRSHVFLLEALERAQREDPLAMQRVRVHLHGVLSDADCAVVEQSPLRERILLHGYTPHAEVVQALVAADLLFLPMHALPNGQRARIVPGKTYEYLRAGAPMLAAVPPGDARDFVAQAAQGDCVEPRDAAAMARVVLRHVREAAPPRGTPNEAVLRFERRVLTQQLAAIFDALA